MNNIVGYICSTPWGTASRTTPSLGWTPVLPALIHEGLTQQMPDYAAAVWRLEGLLGRELSGALNEAACVAAYAALGLPGKVGKAKGVP